MRDKIAGLTSEREELGLSDFLLDPHVIESLETSNFMLQTKEQIASINDPIGDLRRKWFLHKNNYDGIQLLDIEDILGKFSDEEIKNKIVPNLFYMGLCDGCYGNCYFCSEKPNKTITKTFDIESLKEFYIKYRNNIGPNLLYDGKTDPFDYNFGENNFLELLQFFYEEIPEKSHYISTVIPRGSQGLFINTFLWILEKHANGTNIATIRLSVSEQSIQRIETVMHQIENILDNNGFPSDTYNDFMDKKVIIGNRTKDNVVMLGKSIKSHDDFKSTWSPTCSDCIGIDTSGIYEHTMVAATQYFPEGGIKEPFDGSGGHKLFFLDQVSYQGQEENENEGDKLLPCLYNGVIPDNPEDLNTALARELRMIQIILDNLNYDRINWDDERFKNFITFSNGTYEEYKKVREPYINTLQAKVKKELESGNLELICNKSIKHHVELLNFYMKKLTILFEYSHSDNDVTINEGIYLGSFILELGKQQINMIEQIEEELFICDFGDFNSDDIDDLISLSKAIYNNLSKFFIISNEPSFSQIKEHDDFSDILPRWLLCALMLNMKRLEK